VRRTLVGTAVVTLALCLASPASAATTWTRQQVPLPAAGTLGQLLGVSCVSAADCVAVGWFSKRVVRRLLAARWNGTAWSAKEVPAPGGATQRELEGVSCLSATDCIAVGYYDTSNDVLGVPLAEQWNGSTWSSQPLNLPSGTSGTLTGISCTSAASCTAVGYTLSTSTTGGTLAEQWNGSTWTEQSTPNPAGSTYAFLNGVSCASAASCTAVGGSDASGAATFAEQWDGSAWSVTSTVDPAGASSYGLSAISCASAVSCTAVGNYLTATESELMLAEQWDGSAWSIQPTPVLAETNYLSAVSCPSATSCTAVGTWGGRPHALAEFWNGSTWAGRRTAQPTMHKLLLGISCTSAHGCTAVGFAQLATAGFTPLLAEQEQ
jgi:hypothetical protein